MQFNFSYAQTVSKTQMAAFEMAGKIWSSYLTDNVTINIALDVQKDFAGNTIAGAIARTNNYSFSEYAGALKNDADPTYADQSVLGTNTFNRTSFYAGYDAIKVAGSKLSINSANAKSVGGAGGSGIDKKASNVLDGYIVMRDLTGTNTNWNYNFTRQNTTPTNAVDFISVAIHEIGHVLGFQSSIDQPWVGASNTNSAEYRQGIQERVNVVTPLDLFRYSNDTLDIDLSVGGFQYFGLGNYGGALVGTFDTGVDKTRGGNGFQASHWESNGMMDAEVRRGSLPVITNMDLTAFDAIGWDVDSFGINKFINYAQLETEAKQIANQKTTQNIGNAMALMLDSSDIYKPKVAGTTTLEARTGTWWQTFYARTGGWWQEYFARTGGWWQGIKGAFGEEAVFDSVEGEDIKLLDVFNQYANDYTNGKDVDLLTGKAEGAMLVGEDSFIKLDVAADSQFIDFGFTQPLMDFQKNGLSMLDQPQNSQGFESVAFTSTISNVVLGVSNQSQLSSISASSQLTADAFTPWWLGDTSWWTVK